MKIGIIDDLPVGGAKRVCFEQLKYLLSKRHEMTIFSNDVDLVEQEFDNQKLKIIPIDEESKLGINYRGWNRWRREWNLLTRYQKQMKKLACQVDEQGLDAILVHPSKTIQANQVLRYLKTPSVYMCQEWYREWYEPKLHPLPQKLINRSYEKLVRLIKSWLDMLAVKKADIIITGSKYVANQVLVAYGKKSVVIPFGVNTKVFQPTRNPTRDYILFVGSKSEIDGYEVWQKMGAKNLHVSKMANKQVMFKELIYGEGKRLSDVELANLFANAKYVVSLGKNEPFGLVPIEAMACGTNAITFNNGGYIENLETAKIGSIENAEIFDLWPGIKSKLIVTNMASVDLVEYVSKLFSWQNHGEKLEGVLGKLYSNT